LEYEVIYDAAKSVFSGWFFPIVTFIFSFLIWGIVRLLHVINWHWLAIYFEFMLAFTVLLTLLVSAGFVISNTKTRQASKNNTCYLVEGTVENFKYSKSKDRESFKVQNKKFEYSSYSITGGYNQTSDSNGPTLSGRQVRICYIDGSKRNSNLIVRLEVAQEQ